MHIEFTAYANGNDYTVTATVNDRFEEVVLTSAKVDGSELLAQLNELEESELEAAAWDYYLGEGRAVAAEFRHNAA